MSPVQHLLSSATLLLWMALPAIAQAPLERVSTPTRVSGVVFEDRNKNGVYDAGDAPVGGVAVSDQVQEVITDGDGRFTLDARGYGLVFVSQPDGFASAGPFWREVTGASADVAFPLAHAAGVAASAATAASAAKLEARFISCLRSRPRGRPCPAR